MTMIRKATVLSAQQHSTLKLAPTTTYAFARHELFVPIIFSEMADIAREYPLVFLKGNPLPVALLGIEKGVNAYVDKDSNWLATYIPATVQVYPFALVPVRGKPEEMAVVFDADADQLSLDIGYPLFEPDGKPQKSLQSRVDVMRKMKQQEKTTAAMVQHLRDAGILIERTIRVSKNQSDETQIKGVEVVNETALNALPHAEYNKLRDNGVLPLIYAHLLSMANLRLGAIAGKYSPKRATGHIHDEIDLSGLEKLERPDQSSALNRLAGTPDTSLILGDEGDFDLDSLETMKTDSKKDMH